MVVIKDGSLGELEHQRGLARSAHLKIKMSGCTNTAATGPGKPRREAALDQLYVSSGGFQANNHPTHPNHPVNPKHHEMPFGHLGFRRSP
jgi:hypothetical protein|tara:strand:- start:460 stop:729 length:270 start_codon:yes stop_codon:yes gene_type:complete